MWKCKNCSQIPNLPLRSLINIDQINPFVANICLVFFFLIRDKLPLFPFILDLLSDSHKMTLCDAVSENSMAECTSVVLYVYSCFSACYLKWCCCCISLFVAFLLYCIIPPFCFSSSVRPCRSNAFLNLPFC